MNRNPPPPKGCQPRSEAGETVELTRDSGDGEEVELLRRLGSQPHIFEQPKMKMRFS